MSNVQTLINRAMSLNNVDIYQYPSDVALEDFNIIYHQVEDYIKTNIGERYFWDILYTDTVIWINEYKLPSWLTWNFNEAKKIEDLSIKYKNNWDYIKPRLVYIEQLNLDISILEQNQSSEDPIYFIADDSYFIFPSVKEIVVDWIKLYWLKSLIDVWLTTTYENILWGKISHKYYHYISEWLEQFILKRQWKKQEAELAKDVFERKTLPRLIQKLWNRKTWIIKRRNPL